VFLGYSNLHKGFKCVDVSSSHVYISRDVIFDKNIFPFSKLHPNVRARLRDDILMLPSSLIPSGLVHSGVNNTDEPMINLPNPVVQSRFLVRRAQKLMLIMPRCFATYQDLTLKLSHALRQMLISKSMSLHRVLPWTPIPKKILSRLDLLCHTIVQRHFLLCRLLQQGGVYSSFFCTSASTDLATRSSTCSVTLHSSQ
jgi:hypothetical protein